jgi:nicotinamide-nucleotide amidase
MEIKNETLLQKTQSSVAKLTQDLRDNSYSLGFAESCTGGLLSSLFTEQAGVSDVFMGSVISYSNSLKEKLLGVKPETLNSKGAVSSEVAVQMADGCLKHLDVHRSVSLTGIAGPSGGSESKPVGLVFIAVAGLKSETKVFEHHFKGDRKQIQLQACAEAVKHLIEFK